LKTLVIGDSPPGYTSDHIPCTSRKGRGVDNIR
jgi:hypothetical protein